MKALIRSINPEPAPINRRTLRSRIALSLLVYTLLLAAVIFASGHVINDEEEFAIQHSLLTAELDGFIQHRAHEPNYPLPRTSTLRAYVADPGSSWTIPAELRALPPGLHDEIDIASGSVTALVRDVAGQRIYMTFDLTQQEREESSMFDWTMLYLLAGASILAWAIWWLSGKLLRPVSDLAAAIDRIEPDAREQRIAVSTDSATEIATIVGAMNRFFERTDGFVLRERAFIDSVSHELRTPIAVIAGAAEVMGADAALPESSRRPLARIRETAADIEQLIAALLVLAKAPGRLRDSSETCGLEDLVPEIVTAHEHLRGEKTMRVVVGPLVPSTIRAPVKIAQVAIANILRNAIENSDGGRVDVSVQPAGVVRIQDSGHGMSPEEIGRVYAAMARRGSGPSGSGIGLQLIRRICEHLGWTLEITPRKDQGTLVVLDMRSSLTHA